ncbi:dolichyl-P-Man:Man(7)GlcNAc(2)-PP-dolichol alpha-1,6-mannosyltransferase [Sporobolomyces koalae]|uniref:dolichyl-P-Man:Man(7)GlcNAc(2)-PP-dolichol alpha-1,6-mannosyltransferase n=1 Tax=Sporobolomyces koalae TaxID=500713 RepID=UPI003170B4F1
MDRDHLAELLLVLSPAAAVFTAPFTKVEESFTLHAARDLLLHGVSRDTIAQYDHVEFPGAVPRTFVGPALLAGASYPWVKLASMLGLLHDGLDVQILIRLVLAFVSSLSLIFLSRRVRSAFGGRLARYFLAITASQFHLSFWTSRTVPNMIAFPIVQIAIALLVVPPSAVPSKAANRLTLFAFTLLTFATVVLRLELAALLVPLALEQLVRGTIGFLPLVLCGIGSALASLVLTVLVDSFFWQRPSGELFWPEGSSFWFNVIQGKASEWGTSPFYTYFLLTLPKLLLLALPFALLSLFVDRRARRLCVPSLVFVGLLSALEHKEWRFIAYIVPALNVCAASGIHAVGALFASRALRRYCLTAVVLSNLVFLAFGLGASRGNYPGGIAIRKLEALVHTRSGEVGTLNAHVSAQAAMNGASNFVLHDGQLAPTRSWYLSKSTTTTTDDPNLKFSKSESRELDSPVAFARASPAFDYLVVDATDSTYPEVWEQDARWRKVDEVEGFGGIGKFWRGETMGFKKSKQVAIIERVQ